MKVYLISRPDIDWGEWEKFILDENLPSQADSTNPRSELLVEMAGRLCYMSYGKGRKTTKEFIDNLIGMGHHSVLEHANWTIFITGISRSCSHELVRHRHLSYSQLSQRYVDESEVTFITPQALNDTGLDTFQRALTAAQTAYRILVANLDLKYKDVENARDRRKMSREAARAVLPNATETKIAVTGNARAWRQFIQLRSSPHAEPEIRALAVAIRTILNAESPVLFGDLLPTVEGVTDGR